MLFLFLISSQTHYLHLPFFYYLLAFLYFYLLYFFLWGQRFIFSIIIIIFYMGLGNECLEVGPKSSNEETEHWRFSAQNFLLSCPDISGWSVRACIRLLSLQRTTLEGWNVKVSSLASHSISLQGLGTI